MNNKATWIWYPGDFEVWLGNRFNNRRTERGAMFPPFYHSGPVLKGQNDK